MSMRIRILLLLLAIMALSGCATTSSPQGRLQLTAPMPISMMYSEFDMRVYLASSTDTGSPCNDVQCMIDLGFERQVQRLGARLANAAYATYPDLNRRINRFEFVIAEKEDPGSASTAAGKIVIFRGVQKLRLDEDALAFLIAREMGHVIGRHHEENSATRIMFTVLTQVLFPFANLVSGSALLAQPAVSTTASTAASYLGSHLVIAGNKTIQLKEADGIALNLLARQGWTTRDVADSMDAIEKIAEKDAWSKDLFLSVSRINGFAQD
jgi:Zn-dependent protease with chaperone function